MILWFGYAALGWLFGFFLDLCFGDPHWLPHPVRLIGRMVSLSETGLRRLFPKTKAGERTAGAVQTFLIPLTCFAGSFGILYLCFWLHPLLYLAVRGSMKSSGKRTSLGHVRQFP